MRALIGAALVSLVAAQVSPGQQPRDAPRPRVSGTATVHGIVTSRGPQPEPIRRARVVISRLDDDFSETTITTDDGRFSFDGLAAGSYTLSPMKDAYLPGSSTPTIVVGHGARQRVDLRLIRGGVITGRILRPSGDPAIGVNVSALSNRYLAAAGERRWVRIGAAAVQTDDRGIYRIFGLPAGEYRVLASPVQSVTAPLQVLTDAEIREALAQVNRPVWSARPGAPDPPPPSVVSAAPRPALGFAPVYFPGTTLFEGAMNVHVGESEERAGVDFDLDYVALATIEGAVSLPQGAERSSVLIARDALEGAPDLTPGIRSTSTDAAGRFVFRAVSPGRYRLFAASHGHFGTTEVVVGGEDISGLVLSTQPWLQISGRLVFDPPMPIHLTLPAQALTGHYVTNVTAAPAPTVRVDGGRFVLEGLIDAKYRLRSVPPGVRTPIAGWWLKSATIGGREILDEPLELRASATDAVVRWSSTASEVSGRVQDAGERPGRDVLVVIFSRDPRSWFFNSRRVAGVRPGQDGRYIVRNLPPGDYLAVAATGLEIGEWFDAQALRALLPRAVPLSIGGDTVHTLDLRVRRDP